MTVCACVFRILKRCCLLLSCHFPRSYANKRQANFHFVVISLSYQKLPPFNWTRFNSTKQKTKRVRIIANNRFGCHVTLELWFWFRWLWNFSLEEEETEKKNATRYTSLVCAGLPKTPKRCVENHWNCAKNDDSNLQRNKNETKWKAICARNYENRQNRVLIFKSKIKPKIILTIDTKIETATQHPTPNTETKQRTRMRKKNETIMLLCERTQAA